MSDFQVFRGYTLPEAKRGGPRGPRGSKYPFAELQVDDFFVVEKTAKQMYSNVRSHEKSSGNKFVVRAGPIEADGVEIVPAGSVSVWRVAGTYTPKPRKPKVEA